MSAMGRQQLSVGILRLLRVAPKILSEPWPEQDQLQQLRQAVTLLDGSAGNQVAPLAGSNVITLLSGVHSSDPRKRKLEQMAAAAALKAQQEADTHSAKEQAESAQESYNGECAPSSNWGARNDYNAHYSACLTTVSVCMHMCSCVMCRVRRGS